MTTLCGWIGLPPGQTVSPGAAEAMLDACPSEPKQRASRAGGFCCTSGSNAALGEHQDCLVAILGPARWRGDHAAPDAFIPELVQSYRHQGWRFLESLGGEFAIAVADLKARSLLLAVDRIASHPLSYQPAANGIVFGTTLNALRAHPDFQAEIAPQSIFNYLYFHMIPSPGSIYRRTSKLLPAEYVHIARDGIERGHYWRADYRDSAADESVLANELREKLDAAVRNCVDARTPTGTFLSGGLDSSTVTGILQQQASSPVAAYSIGFDAEGYDETPFARDSASHFGAELHTYYVTPEDVVAAVPLLAQHQDEPFGNASAIPAYYCARFAREQGMGSLLAGDGGDELFAGNARYAKQKVFAVYDALPAFARRAIIEPVTLRLPGFPPPLRKLRSYVEQARIPMPERMETYNFLHRTPLEEIFNADFLASVNPDDPIDNIRDAYSRAASDSMLKRMLHMDLKITLADNDLRKVRQSCELAGIDVRFPMLDDELVAFSATIPDRLLMRGFELRSFYRRALGGLLSPTTLDKNKHGFGLPFGVWMAENRKLKELAFDSLSDFRGRGYVSSAYLDELIGSHQRGHSAYYGVMIWVIMMLELWLQSHSGQ